MLAVTFTLVSGASATPAPTSTALALAREERATTTSLYHAALANPFHRDTLAAELQLPLSLLREARVARGVLRTSLSTTPGVALDPALRLKDAEIFGSFLTVELMLDAALTKAGRLALLALPPPQGDPAVKGEEEDAVCPSAFPERRHREVARMTCQGHPEQDAAVVAVAEAVLPHRSIRAKERTLLPVRHGRHDTDVIAEVLPQTPVEARCPPIRSRGWPDDSSREHFFQPGHSKRPESTTRAAVRDVRDDTTKAKERETLQSEEDDDICEVDLTDPSTSPNRRRALSNESKDSMRPPKRVVRDPFVTPSPRFTHNDKDGDILMSTSPITPLRPLKLRAGNAQDKLLIQRSDMVADDLLSEYDPDTSNDSEECEVSWLEIPKETKFKMGRTPPPAPMKQSAATNPQETKSATQAHRTRRRVVSLQHVQQHRPTAKNNISHRPSQPRKAAQPKPRKSVVRLSVGAKNATSKSPAKKTTRIHDGEEHIAAQLVDEWVDSSSESEVESEGSSVWPAKPSRSLARQMNGSFDSESFEIARTHRKKPDERVARKMRKARRTENDGTYGSNLANRGYQTKHRSEESANAFRDYTPNRTARQKRRCPDWWDESENAIILKLLESHGHLDQRRFASKAAEKLKPRRTRRQVRGHIAFLFRGVPDRSLGSRYKSKWSQIENAACLIVEQQPNLSDTQKISHLAKKLGPRRSWRECRRYLMDRRTSKAIDLYEDSKRKGRAYINSE